jgi:hypothetical protein
MTFVMGGFRREQATAKTEADPYGMTNKKTSKGKGKSPDEKNNRRSFDCATHKMRESLRSG